MKSSYYFSILLLFFLNFNFGCSTRNERTKSSHLEEANHSAKKNNTETKQTVNPNKIGKAVFYLENSGSMFAYVNGLTEYVKVVSELAQKAKFAEEHTQREFYFVNGGQKLQLNSIGNKPSDLKNKLNKKAFDCGNPSESNLNSMFQLALSKAQNDTISILVSDAIYDVSKTGSNLNALEIEGKETRTKFIERLTKGNIQTIIIKLTSVFNGSYFPLKGGKISLSQKRPFYIWIFGRYQFCDKYSVIEAL